MSGKKWCQGSGSPQYFTSKGVRYRQRKVKEKGVVWEGIRVSVPEGPGSTSCDRGN